MAGTPTVATAALDWPRQMQQQAAALDYQDLEACLADPDDEGLVAWFAGKLPVGAAVAVRAAPGQGVRQAADGRRYAWSSWRFEAAHRLPHVPAGHKCGRVHGHGFRVVIHVPLGAGGLGWGADHDRLADAWRPLHAQLHGRYLNDLPGLDNPTSEWLSVWIWQAVRESLGPECWVTVYETASCGAHFDGTHHHIWKDFTLDSATLEQGRLLGHTFTTRLYLTGPLHAEFGWAQDFADVKALFDPVFRRLDHHPLHEIADLAGPAQAGTVDGANIAHYIRARTQQTLPALSRVDILDGCGGGASLQWGGCDLQPLPEG